MSRTSATETLAKSGRGKPCIQPFKGSVVPERAYRRCKDITAPLEHPEQVKQTFIDCQFVRHKCAEALGMADNTLGQILQGRYAASDGSLIKPERAKRLERYREIWQEALNQCLDRTDWFEVLLKNRLQRITPEIVELISVNSMLLKQVWDGRVDSVRPDILDTMKEALATASEVITQQGYGVHYEVIMDKVNGTSERKQFAAYGGIDPQTGRDDDRRRDPTRQINVNIGINTVPGGVGQQLLSLDAQFGAVFGQDGEQAKCTAGSPAAVGRLPGPTGEGTQDQLDVFDGRANSEFVQDRSQQTAPESTSEPTPSHEGPNQDSGPAEFPRFPGESDAEPGSSG